MKNKTVIIILALLAAAFWFAHVYVVRWDMTGDKRYSINERTQQLVRSLDAPMMMTLYLDGPLNPGFVRLRKAVLEMGEELHTCQPLWNVQAVDKSVNNDSMLLARGLTPTTIHERTQDGRMVQTTIWPYVALTYHQRIVYVPLLHNNRGKSGEQNLNESIENLEYALAEAMYSLVQEKTTKIAFLEGHGELSEHSVWDISTALARYFQIDRGILGNDPAALNDYRVVIIADPQRPFSESDKYILDQYVMHGGRILWLVNGVRLDQDVLASDGFSPVLPLDLHLADMFFTYGVRVEPTIVQDVQCLSIPVDVSADRTQANYQPMPWFYAPLLLTSQYSPITRNVGQISSSFVSHIEAVGNDSLKRIILLATSTASRVIGTPTEVNLGELNPNLEDFRWQYLPVAMSVEGVFHSAFHHRMVPDSITLHERLLTSAPTKQIVVATGSIIRNEWQHGKPLPVGYDRYSGMQFGNKEFLTNAVLYLADDLDLMELRKKEIALRLINDERAHEQRSVIQLLSIVLPIILLILASGIVIWRRKHKYTV